MITSLFNLTGSSRRRELWLALAIVLMALSAAFWLQGHDQLWRYAPLAQAATALAGAGLLIAILRRLHALRWSGLWALLAFVPFVSAGLVLLLGLRRGRQQPNSRSGVALIGAAAALMVAFGLFGLFYTTLRLPGHGMSPTLLAGDYVAARHINSRDIERGDVLVLRQPLGELRLTRIIGLPGDHLQMKEGRLWLNGVALPQTAAGVQSETMGPQGPLGSRPRCQGGLVGDGGLCQKSIWTEILPEGRSYDVLNIEERAYADNTAMITLGQDQFFGLGDNRDHSLDSRFAAAVGGLGIISGDQIMARAQSVLLSSAGRSLWQVWTWRFDRFFEAVK